MIIIPAIDIIDGKPVRLYQGDYGKKEVVGQSVMDIAQTFEQLGADYLHLVDLDGAKSGTKDNAKLIIDVARALSIPVEVGGGIRSMEDIDFYLQAGLSRVILGTVALENKALLKEALAKYGEKIAVGIDCKNGYVCGSGWLTDSNSYYIDFAKEMEQLGVQTIIFTDISKDGTLAGPNLEMLRNLKESVTINITASGGIKDISHIEQLKNLDVYGAITGKAMYAKTLDLKEAIALCKE
ncbi:MAG: 1-(5-phosphoribosyl)-5-[(5-phosphoribosylamino)methylideneamino]imidazole-4-carboxamide isomerase [Bacillota bacterium]|nr:1-(5-phosphoribosyl)-5-[(5-phosphoribosylamino)methylideneamino]imidazole-4-carboxamide isomerase [Bacillota bacterium]